MCFKKKSYLWGELIKRHLFSLDKEMVVGLVHLLFCCLRWVLLIIHTYLIFRSVHQFHSPTVKNVSYVGLTFCHLLVSFRYKS